MVSSDPVRPPHRSRPTPSAPPSPRRPPSPRALAGRLPRGRVRRSRLWSSRSPVAARVEPRPWLAARGAPSPRTAALARSMAFLRAASPGGVRRREQGAYPKLRGVSRLPLLRRSARWWSARAGGTLARGPLVLVPPVRSLALQLGVAAEDAFQLSHHSAELTCRVAFHGRNHRARVTHGEGDTLVPSILHAGMPPPCSALVRFRRRAIESPMAIDEHSALRLLFVVHKPWEQRIQWIVVQILI